MSFVSDSVYGQVFMSHSAMKCLLKASVMSLLLIMGSFSPIITSGSSVFFKDFMYFQNAAPLQLHFEKEDR